MLTPPIIALAGFSGSGKTTVLGALKELMGPGTYVDLDQVIESEFGPIPEIVQNQGWSGFRAIEKQKLQETLALKGLKVLALGGGALEENLASLDSKGVFLVHLSCPFEVCWSRIQGNLKSRPLTALGEEAMREIFEKRKAQYERGTKIDATMDPSRVALAILKTLRLA